MPAGLVRSGPTPTKTSQSDKAPTSGLVKIPQQDPAPARSNPSLPKKVATSIKHALSGQTTKTTSPAVAIPTHNPETTEVVADMTPKRRAKYEAFLKNRNEDPKA